MGDEPRGHAHASTPARIAALVAAAALLAACTSGSDPGPPDPSKQADPPPPPAACLLDREALAAATGLTWTPDLTTANDTRCVYDPAGAPENDFVAVDLAPTTAADATAELDTLAELCEQGSRAPLRDAERGFVCRFQEGRVFAAAVRGGQVVTVAASAVPAGTTAARLVVAFAEQLDALR